MIKLIAVILLVSCGPLEVSLEKRNYDSKDNQQEELGLKTRAMDSAQNTKAAEEDSSNPKEKVSEKPVTVLTPEQLDQIAQIKQKIELLDQKVKKECTSATVKFHFDLSTCRKMRFEGRQLQDALRKVTSPSESAIEIDQAKYQELMQEFIELDASLADNGCIILRKTRGYRVASDIPACQTILDKMRDNQQSLRNLRPQSLDE